MKINDNINLAECGFYTDEDGEVLYDEWDDYLADDIMSEYIKDADKYLVFARGCRWNGASGYKFASTTNDILSRSYDFSLVPTARSKGKKVLVCRESSHDVPMGSTTIIVALTEKEYEELEESDFEEVQKFAEDMERKAV